MNRTSLGITAAALLIIGAIAVWRGPADGSAAGFAGGCVRIGLVLGALWLAMPQIMAFLARTPRWLLTAGVIGVVICAVRPMLLLLVIPVLGALWFFGPRLATQDDRTVVPRRPRRRSQS
jgi:hypothetical protein